MDKIKSNFNIIVVALMMPEILMVVMYYLLSGVVSPDFGDFGYYFMMNVCKISKFQYSMMGVISQVTGILGTIYYEKNLKDIEVRTMIYWSTWISVISGICSYAFAMRWNLLIGIPDGVFIVITDTVFGVIQQAMNFLPSLALFAKITPPKVEGTVFALLTGSSNLSSTLISPLIGVWLNDRFIHVTANDLSNYKGLCMVSLLTTFFGFLLIPLIPTKE
jgi:MFS-type transporter involved in bile tolerance (Atg22 family)